MAPRLGLVGRTLGHSHSPAIHALLGASSYEKFEVEPGDVDEFLAHGPWDGVNVTIPYKANAARVADERTPQVEALGVANTLVRRADGTILAANTDVEGFGWQLEHACRRELGCDAREAIGGGKVLVLGSGGAAAAVRQALAEHTSARVVTISRSGTETYNTLAERHADAVAVVNCTPVGTYPACPASPLDDKTFCALSHLRIVLDVVYNPRLTGLCLQAERTGIAHESGLAMLVAQAAGSARHFGTAQADDAQIASILDEMSWRTGNIVLIGMPGCGKTTTGRALAHACGRPFVDLDDAFEIEHGIGCSECITTLGEDRFREMESEVVASYGKRSGLIIACGGGVVTRERNYAPLHQNGTIVHITRDISQLDTQGRPLSATTGVERLAQERMPLYRAWADLTHACSGTPDGDATAILEAMGHAR